MLYLHTFHTQSTSQFSKCPPFALTQALKSLWPLIYCSMHSLNREIRHCWHQGMLQTHNYWVPSLADKALKYWEVRANRGPVSSWYKIRYMTFESHLCGFCLVGCNKILLKSPVSIPEQSGVQSSHYGLQYSVLIHFRAGFNPFFTKMQLGSIRITHSPPNHHWGGVMAALNFWNYFMGFPRAWSIYPVIPAIETLLNGEDFLICEEDVSGPLLAYRCSRCLCILAPSASSTMGWGNVWYSDDKLYGQGPHWVAWTWILLIYWAPKPSETASGQDLGEYESLLSSQSWGNLPSGDPWQNQFQ